MPPKKGNKGKGKKKGKEKNEETKSEVPVDQGEVPEKEKLLQNE